MYSLRLVRSVLSRLHDSSSDDAKLDVQAALRSLPPHMSKALILREEGYNARDIGRKVLGNDAWMDEGEWLLVFAEREVLKILNRGRRRGMTEKEARKLAEEIEDDYEAPYSVMAVYDVMGEWRVVVAKNPIVLRSKEDWKKIRKGEAA